MPHEPKKRHSRARQGKRRAAISLKTTKGVICPNCKNVTLPHTVCKYCGFYAGKQIVMQKESKAKAQESA
jgi:large subunit ribosomal protein L32